MPVEIICQRFGCEVIAISPHALFPSVELRRVCTEQMLLNHEVLESCLLPGEVQDAEGRTSHRPATWTADEEVTREKHQLMRDPKTRDDEPRNTSRYTVLCHNHYQLGDLPVHVRGTETTVLPAR